ncbi:MAG: hypothetical protein V7L17_27845 [Nostoc sp.]
MAPYYKLDGHTPIPVDFEEWATWRTTANTQVIFSIFQSNISVSTVFTGINIGTIKEPKIFESLVMGGSCDGQKRFYSNWDEAISGHYHLLLESIATTPPTSY